MQALGIQNGDRLIYRHALDIIGVWRNDESIHTCQLPRGIDRFFIARIAKSIAFAGGFEISRRIDTEEPDYTFELKEKT